MQGILVFIIVFFIVVTVHELGHFLIAKRSGILCQEFSIGFGPKIFHKKIGETNFTIRLLPVGGYVKMPDNVFDFNNEVSPYDIQKGMKLRLKLDGNDQIEKIILDKSNDIELLEIEVNEFDLTEKLFIEGYINNGEELERFTVKKDACVMFSGMEEQIAPVERMFSSHSWQKKFATLFAGPLFNFILGALIFVGLAIYNGVPQNKPIIGSITENSPAAIAGLQTGDIIKDIDNTNVSTWREIRSNISKSEGREITLKIERESSEKIIKVTPKIIKDEKGNTSYLIGIGYYYEKGDIFESIKYGFIQTLNYGTIIFTAIINLFKSFSIDQLGGPVAIYERTTEVAQSGLETTLEWIGLLSINLGLMNLIPIPVLDGGRILFVLYEGIFGRPFSKRAQYYATAIFSILLIILMLAVTWNDITRLFS
ncbi:MULTISPECIES: RIP metalloprotease RseP [unclassified Gemella]|uniref:RIP metalloprotease RseP n=1 Tax=unclassified Gemella TaxID=2624949 RepID=UPI0010736F6F|nr:MULTISPECIES: RIP metalloprotease RseP [unclassified Gemella]MBF0710087.1 RIP metalloprotease RseP [Gemella sp. GL1.1]MBF0746166.1 RIP metalloprotease RseP [Gemella sp. 19428wG2_WT2a]NYS27431.1 RIP metalloprotease RseP [Gemella sp. GL1]TFU60451.1 RIP metalloprotease RseP [Gemella sp. WT2a]